jgi:NTE family protein
MTRPHPVSHALPEAAWGTSDDPARSRTCPGPQRDRSRGLLRAALWAGVICATLSGCSSARPWINPPLAAEAGIRYDGRRQFADPTRAPDLLVVASFSGGGSRAASFAHAALAELDARRFVWQGRETSLASEVDMVTGVSGGSVAAAHLALHGLPGHLARFGADFLDLDVQSRLLGAALSPSNLHRMTSPWYGRGHVLADELDALLFAGSTFGSLDSLPGRPYLVIGATDLASGADFDFASDQFAALCSSVDTVPLAFAVAASSSVPLVFSPLTLANHAHECPVPLGRNGAPSAPDGTTTANARQRMVRAELDAVSSGGRRFVHLVDGGLSDNLGLRRIADYVSQAGGLAPVLSLLGTGPPPRRIVFLSVNAERRGPRAIDDRDRTPGTLDVLGAMVEGSLGRSSRETALVFADTIDGWRGELRAARGASPDADVFLVEIDLSDVADATLRERVLAIPTAFRITAADRADLRAAAAAALGQSAELRRFLVSVGSPPTAGSAARH